MNILDLLIEERAKNELIRQKLDESNSKIVMLESLCSGGEDEFDSVLQRAITKKKATKVEAHHKSAYGINHSIETSLVQKSSLNLRLRKDSIWPIVLSFLGQAGVDLDDLERSVKSLKNPPSRANLRTLMMKMRQQGYVENPRNGFYKLTENGFAAIEAAKSEMPAVVGTSAGISLFNQSLSRDNKLEGNQ
jgi:hypothetical protein